MTPEKSGTQRCTLAYSYGGIMIFLANKLLRQETEADRNEFVRGLAGLDKNGGKKALAGLVAGYLISKAIKKNG
jgi:hypothetical protein